MSKVCEHCKELYAREASDAWAAWWHDDTPPIYKEVADMTVYDCNKLKNLLELEVAALESKLPMISMETSTDDFEWWQTLLLILVYVVIILIVVMIYYFWRQRRRKSLLPSDDKENIEDKGSPKETSSNELSPQGSATAVPPKKEEKSKVTTSNWVRQKARPIFVHNEAALRRQHQRYKEKEHLRETLIQKHIEKWTSARGKNKKKEKQNSKEREENEVDETKE